MEILLADSMGLCFGVRRAIELAEASLQSGRTVNTFGPLVHNPQEISRLREAGVTPVENPEAVSADVVVIRAHGARPEVFEALNRRHITIVDATCPFVKKSQSIARKLAQQGMTLVIIGHPDHPEVQGILGYAPSPAFIVSRPEEVAALPPDITPGIIAQTTVNEQVFQEVVTAMQARYPAATVFNTVCVATRERQESARRLAAQADAVYVIGGRHSSNTTRLYEICQQVCPKTFLIETAEEIDPEDLAGVARVGITAGASTPAWLVEEIIERLQKIETENPVS